MDCTRCNNRKCREGEQCAAVSFDTNQVIKAYHNEQNIVQAAAQLVDFGRAGTLSRIQELVEFSKSMNFQTIGLAYCYGMENDAFLISSHLRTMGLKVEAVSCTVGGLVQSAINQTSNICKVACNPIGQARQLNAKKPDLVVTMGLCMGHDILFNREIKSDTTTLVVKDRAHQHQPLRALLETTNQ